MNILITGATGFAGSWITRALQANQHEVTCVVRNVQAAKKTFPNAHAIPCDFLTDNDVDTWIPRLKNIDVVINCVGIFYHPDKKVIWALHYDTPKALFQAAEVVGVKRIIQLSALGIEQYDNDYANSKKETELFLSTLKTSVTILKPSVIYGPGSQGSMSVIRSLASLPGIVPLPGSGMQTFQPIHVEDLARAVSGLVIDTGENHQSYTAVSEKKVTFRDMITTIRSWLGMQKPKFLSIPLIFMKIMAIPGDYLSKSTLNSTAIQMMEQNNVTSMDEYRKFEKTIGFTPDDFEKGIHKMPSTEADRWYAKLFLVKPMLRLSLAFMWIASALVTLLPQTHAVIYERLAMLGLPMKWQVIMHYGASFLDFIIGLALLFNYQTAKNCIFQIFLILIYTTIISLTMPYFWLEPFGSVVKNIPVLVAIWMLYNMEAQ